MFSPAGGCCPLAIREGCYACHTLGVSCTPCVPRDALGVTGASQGCTAARPAASLLSGVMWMQSEGFFWETSHLNFKSCFPGAQMLLTGLKSEAKLSFHARGFLNKPHQLPQRLHVLGTLPPSFPCSKTCAGIGRSRALLSVSHWRNASPAGWQITPRSAALEEPAAAAGRCCNWSTACAWCSRGVPSETPREEVPKPAWQMEAVLCEPGAAC